MAKWFYYDGNGVKQGPITSAQLKALATKGVVIPTTRIATETGKESVASKINGLEFGQPVQVPIPKQLRAKHAVVFSIIAIVVVLGIAFLAVLLWIKPNDYEKPSTEPIVAAAAISEKPQEPEKVTGLDDKHEHESAEKADNEAKTADVIDKPSDSKSKSSQPDQDKTVNPADPSIDIFQQPASEEIDIDFSSTKPEKATPEEEKRINANIRDYEDNQKKEIALILHREGSRIIGNITKMKGGIKGLSLQRNGMGGIGGPFQVTLPNGDKSIFAVLYLKNEMDKPIKSATFHLTIIGKGRTIPYGELTMAIKFAGGIEPSETVSSWLVSISKDDPVTLPADTRLFDKTDNIIKLVGFTYFDDEEIGVDALHPKRN